jgi:pilus assembly protein CpaF
VTTFDADLVDRVRARLAAGRQRGPTAVADAVRAETGGLWEDAELVVAVHQEITGAGPLAALLVEPGVTDVLVNGAEQVFVDRGAGLEPAGRVFADERAVRRLAERLAAQAGRRLDAAAPWVDAVLPDGVRLHAVLSPLASPGPCVSLRVPRATAFTLAELVTSGCVPDDGARLLADLVRSRRSFVVSGGTGSGKTTLLSALLGLCAPADRLVLVEDSAELRPDLPHVVRLLTRPPNQEGAGAVTLRDLVRQALRMRPDRLVLGEVRGAEVVDLLAALNTGHEGGAGTVHANAAADVPARFEALAGLAGIGREALHSQLAAAVRVVVHLVRSGATRRVAEVAVLERGPDGGVRAVSAWTWDGRAAHGVPGPAARELVVA